MLFIINKNSILILLCTNIKSLSYQNKILLQRYPTLAIQKEKIQKKKQNNINRIIQLNIQYSILFYKIQLKNKKIQSLPNRIISSSFDIYQTTSNPLVMKEKSYLLQKEETIRTIYYSKIRISRLFRFQKKQLKKMYNGLNTVHILQNCCLSGIHLLESINEIQEQYIDKLAIEDENYRITLFNIISNKTQKTLLSHQKFSRILQSFNILIDQKDNFDCSELFIEKRCKPKLILLQDQYFLPIHFKNQQQTIKVTSEIQNIYKYFLKQKIIQFKPKIILLGIEIDNNFEFESYYLKKIIHQLNKLSQNSLIIFPIKMSNINKDKYFQTLVQCMNALNTYKQAKKNHIQDNDRAMKSKNYLPYIERMSQTSREKQYYKLQLQSLNSIHKLEQINDDKSQERFNFPVITPENEIVYVILQDSERKEFIEIDSNTKYYVSYMQEYVDNKLTMSIIQNEQLYWGEINLNQIQIKNENESKNKIYFQKIAVFQNNPNSSFLLDQYKFYQVTLGVNEIDQYIGTVIIYNFEKNQIKVDQFSVQNEQRMKCHIKGFTVIKHSKTSFSVLSGCKDGDLYQQIGIKLDLVEFNSLKLYQFQKQQSRLPKGYDNPLIVKFEPNSDQGQNFNQFLYFESQTKYFASPFSPYIYKIFFSECNSICQSQPFSDIMNAHLFQKYSKLFRSDQINLKYQNPMSNRKKFDLIVFDKTFERTNFKEFNDNKDITLQKYSQQNYLHFKFQYSPNSLLKIDLKMDSFLLQNSIADLNKICLYNNWLEDQKFQYVFLYNRLQHIYLLYYQKDKSRQYSKRKFVFYNQENPTDYIPFDEVMINDYYNSMMWVVRKYYDRSDPYLVVYSCHWMRLQDIKDADINAQIKVKMDKLFEINIQSKVIDLIGLEVQKSNNTLLICASTFICKIQISDMLNHQESIQNQIQKGTFLYEICQAELNICQDSPMILLNLNENKIALFYQYCMVNCLDEKQGQFQIEIKAKIWFEKSEYKQNADNYLIYNSSYDFKDQDDLEQTKDQSLIKFSFNYEASDTLILAKILLVQLTGSSFEFLIFFEQEFGYFYVGLYQFCQNKNSIDCMRMIKLSKDTIQFLQSISTNKYETLFMQDQLTYLIHSESTLQLFFFKYGNNQKQEESNQKQQEFSQKQEESNQKQLLLN
ncbi:unnamed protein product (macronuclear) [Paramecium tetraurelia]|uniref:Uncharacterized protein n=1 Tax=Paramecium tetraurelia TaxID=5888 RepID=A0CWK2_PARTE|nr:uncharacterized protein GSPATT00001372001 [Paramecium tetraurelia]CAK75169.1 unnamed protein product [Paramecium tetraurelia]|eukprot:XP_001442566.1 hypothetical protein (macronuclear) [Paramecium tetraurelia strain d4-2]